ncbi:MAG TPA: zinc dependent phospholipase C family protein [Pseudacidobacterium sp.]|jgi:hypothetical protein|nr:zinc dependent phospholipase C family protein [Pseudacidobacterium sp.]
MDRPAVLSASTSKSIFIAFLCVLFQVTQSLPCSAYSVLTHQQIIDLAWGPSIKPLLLARYPSTTAAQLRDAQAYAYGGCVIQDAGYYPFGHIFFSDLTHYVRTGDFIASLIRNSRNVNELAFALGALSHYLGDSIGHQDAVNPSTAIAFPKLALQYGQSVTYDESPHGHVRTEFAFDIDQLTKHRLAPAAYLNHIGLKVSPGLLDRAFFETYGLHLNNVLGKKRESAVVISYRHSVRSFLPAVAHAEALLHEHNFPPDSNTEPSLELDERIEHADYQHGWQNTRKHAGFRTHLLAFVVFLVPKVGPASDLAIKIPTPETETKYAASVIRTLDRYQKLLDNLRANSGQDPEVAMNLDNRDLDTGYIVQPGGYPRTDKTYAELLTDITKYPDRPAPSGLKRDILAYYADPSSPIITKKNAKAWKRVQYELAILETMPVVPVK